MTTFAEAARDEASTVLTENGAKAFDTTKNPCLDFYSVVGSLREAEQDRITLLFQEAYDKDPLTAMRTVFYARDIRGGLGERNTFRVLIRYIAEHIPEALIPNLSLIGEYGRWDDVYSLVGTPIEDKMWKVVKSVLDTDVKNMAEGKPVSLLAKWLKTADASSRNTRKIGIYTAQKLCMDVRSYKCTLKALRKYLKITERDMSANEWYKINYEAVPSRAMMLYTNAFNRHDYARFLDYSEAVANGKKKVNSGTLYPYDIVEKYLGESWFEKPEISEEQEKMLENQWNALPDYVKPGNNILVIADVSGSMYGRPLCSSIGLAIYFAEKNTGPYHDLAMEFSGDSKYIKLKGRTLKEKIANLEKSEWGGSTNLEGALQRVLDTAVQNHIPQKDLPEALIIISDMEINACTNDGFFMNEMERKYAEAGYTLPAIVFWNVNSRHDIYHVDGNHPGVQLVSGQSASAFKMVLDCMEVTPTEAMMKVINSERYQPVTVCLPKEA